MRAMLLRQHGGPENLVLADAPVPELKPGHVRVRLAATSINMVDTKIRAGLPIGPALPAILGCDLAGTVEALGDGVTDFAVGDAVYGCAGGVLGQGGTLAEVIVADARLLAPAPRTLSLREAAALPLVAITAWEALERAGVRAGQHVLVHGGTGGVGHVALQLANALGATVATTVSGDDKARVARDLGASETVDYRQEKPGQYVARLTQGHGFDAVIDTIGGANLSCSFIVVRDGGQVSTTNARIALDLSPLHAKGLSLHVVFMLLPMLTGVGRERHGAILREVARLVDDGRLRPLIDPHRFALDEAAQAHAHLESGTVTGKVVVDIAPVPNGRAIAA